MAESRVWRPQKERATVLEGFRFSNSSFWMKKMIMEPKASTRGDQWRRSCWNVVVKGIETAIDS